MKVVGVISSAHPGGNSATLVREALKGAAAEGAVTTEIFLPKYRIEFCTGCLQCMAEGRCPQPDDFETLRAILCEADGIILGAPTFGSAPNARMKNFMDRFGLFEFFTASLGGKHLAAISTASMGAGAGRKVAAQMAKMFTSGVFLRGYVSGVLGVKARGEGIDGDAKALKRAEELGRKLASDIEHRRSHPLQNLPTRAINRFLLQPMFRGAILSYKEGMMKGVHDSLKGRGLIP